MNILALYEVLGVILLNFPFDYDGSYVSFTIAYYVEKISFQACFLRFLS